MKKAGKIKSFFLFLSKVFAVLAVMAVIAAGSFEGVTYYLTGKFYDMRQFAEREDKGSESRPDSENKKQAEDKNLKNTMIFVEGEESTEQYMALHMMNMDSGAVDILLIPLHAQVNVGTDLLREIKKKIPKAENTLKIDDIVRVYGDDRYPVLCRIFENVLGLDISGYDAVPRKKFIKILDMGGEVPFKLDNAISYRDQNKVLKSIEEGENDLDGEKAMALLSYLDGTDKQESDRLENVSAYLESWVDSLLKNHRGAKLVKRIINAADAGDTHDSSQEQKIWEKIKPDAVTIRILQGSETEGLFVIDSQKAQLQITALAEQAASYNRAGSGDEVVREDGDDGDDDTDAASSKEYSIELYNAAYVSGLAASWEGFLEEEGYNISIVDSYQDEGPISQTRIIVNQEGIGRDLLEYFPNADIWTDSIDTGGDIRIYIGTDSTNVGGNG